MRRALALLAASACALLLAACGEPLPTERLSYAGEWRGPNMRLLITPDGRCEYTRQRGASNVEVNGPIQRFEGDNFVVGLGPFNTTFVVSSPPRVEGGRWKMTVDGVELTRVGAFDEVRT